ncbi:MAG: transporter substrate-binding domain-containing protein, partial [Rheinheimera sp.]|nr:transporter substrate-binding domain-containing protein [Rheinheimera sp.]
AGRYQLGDTGIEIYSNVFMQRDMPVISKLEQLKPYAIGVVDKSSHVATLQQLVPEVILKRYPNVSAMYDAALAGDINVITGLDRLPPRYPRYEELNRQFPLFRKIPLRNIDLNYAVRKQQPIFAVLQQATSEIEQAFVDRLERRWLGLTADEDTLLLGLAIDNPPYMHVSLQGEAQGLFVDLWRHWSDITGVKIAFVPDTSFNNLQNLTKGRIDALIGFPDNSRLPQGVVPAYQLYGFQSQFFAPADASATLLNAAAEIKVGVFDNAPYSGELRKRYPQIDIVQYRHLTDMVNATLEGELAGFYAASAIAPLRLRQMDRAEVFRAQENSNIVSPIYSLVRDDNPELAERIRQGFARVSLDTLIQMEQKWVQDESQHYFARFRQQTPLTEFERSWLAEHPSLRIGMLTNWPPMEFVDDNGEPAGVTFDMLQLLQQRLGITFDIQTFDSFELMLSALKQKKIDLVANVSEREERKEFARFTDEFWSTQWAVIGASNTENIVSAGELSGKKVAIYKDYQLAQHLTDVYPAIEVIRVDTLRDGLEMLQRGKVE